jgi:N-acetylglucosamine kinase-like BadF-type ATPase
LLPEIRDLSIRSVIFYGAGCLPEKRPIIKDTISEIIAPQNTEVHSDLLGAAHALCGREAGIACILGTGSNSCFYDGKQIVSNVSSLGFILGDEGSGAYLGKVLVSDLLKNQLPEQMKDEFLKQYHLTVPEIIDRVYRKPFPNRFLAGFSPFLVKYIDDPQIYMLVENGFHSFFQRNVTQYDYDTYEVHLIGSIAFFFQDIIKETAKKMCIRIGKILKEPMEGLINYHSEE